MAEARIKTTIEFAPEDYERLADYADSHGVGLARAIGLLIDGIAPGKKFIPPSAAEVASYCKAQGYTFDPVAFWGHYDAKGWKIGKDPMKKWKSACVTWQAREKPVVGKYPSSEELKQFNSVMVGANAQKYLESFRQKFGCDPKEI